MPIPKARTVGIRGVGGAGEGGGVRVGKKSVSVLKEFGMVNI